jgi:hypothetical protein
MLKPLSRTVFSAGLVLSLVPAAVLADPTTVTEVPAVEGELILDGVPDEDFWAKAAQIELVYETQPAENAKAAVRTTAYLADNGREILLAFRAEDPDPSKIRAFLRDRDSLWQDDFVGFSIDTFNDQRRAFEFFANPLGAQGDLILDGASGEEDSSWDGLWDSAGQINSSGYTVEIRIPYSTLRFQKSAGPQIWGVDVLRFYPRDNRYRLSNNKLVRSNNCYLCGLSKLRGFSAATPGRDLEITPTLTARYGQQRQPGQSWQGDGGDAEFGVDVKWGLGPNSTLNATLNPDFSQVESGQAQLDLNTTFALFFPEKRPFFLEGADYFNTPNNVLYTRTVADPDAGLRLTGRNQEHTYGVFAAQDASTQILIPGVFGSQFRFLDQGSTAAAGRYRYDFDGQASIGAVSTLRSGDDYQNFLGGLDGRWQSGSHTLVGQWLSTRTENPADMGLPDRQDGDALFASYDFSNRNWNFNAAHISFDEGFRADLGFIGQVGYDKSVVGGGRTWHGADGAAINRARLNGDWDITHDESGRVLEREIEAYFSVNGPRQSYFELGGLSRDRLWNNQLFPEKWLSFYSEITPRSGLSLGGFVRKGDQIDYANTRLADVVNFEPWINMNIGKGVDARISHSHQKISRDGGDLVTAGLTDLRLSWQLNLRQRLRLSAIWQDIRRDLALYDQPEHFDTRTRDLGLQFLYSYKINPRTALFAGYSDGRFANDQVSGLFNSDRTIFMKLGYAWQPE